MPIKNLAKGSTKNLIIKRTGNTIPNVTTSRKGKMIIGTGSTSPRVINITSTIKGMSTTTRITGMFTKTSGQNLSGSIIITAITIFTGAAITATVPELVMCMLKFPET
jgi:hypothetical protein